MQKRALGRSGLSVSAIGYGHMGLNFRYDAGAAGAGLVARAKDLDRADSRHDQA